MKQFTAVIAAAALASLGAVASATAATAAPDTGCQKAGLKTLIGAGLIDDVAKGGLPISTAVALGVTPRPTTDVSALPDSLPLSVILADHRAGTSSLFVYPWC